MAKVVETPVASSVEPKAMSQVEMECMAELVKASVPKPAGLVDFEREMALAQQAPKAPVAPGERILRGAKAVTGAPTREDLPVVEAGLKDKTGMVIDRYIAVLLKAGHTREAGAIGNLYNKLVRHNLISVPEEAELLK